MSEPQAPPAVGRRRRRWPWVAATAAVLVLVVFYLGGGWFFSGQVYDNALAVKPKDPATIETGTLTSVDLTAGGTGTITFTRDAQYADETKNNAAVVGIKAGDTLLIAGPASSVEGAAVTRPVTETIGALPEPGATAGLVRDVWLDPTQLGLAYQDVSIEGPLGPLPAWVVPGADEGRWAVLTHGKGADRSEMLRMAGPLHEAGFNLLIVSYRNDPGAPQSEDQIHRYGATEWRDLQAAVEFVLDKGAAQLVLGGLSHGGAVTLGFMAHSDLADRVTAIILDSPAASLPDVLDAAAEYRRLPVVGAPIPESLEAVATWITGMRYGVDMAEVDYTGMAGLVTVPTLVFQGTADETAPQAATDKFAAAFGDKVTYVKVPGAEHVLSWNYDPQGYEDAVADFLSANGLG